MDQQVLVYSTLLFLAVTISAVYLSRVITIHKWRLWFSVFILLAVAYSGFVLLEKFNSAQREEELRHQLNLAREQIVAEQNITSNRLLHLSLATLDLLHATQYREYPSFRLGMMWYWMGAKTEAIFHFKHDFEVHRRNLAAVYNLGIVLASDGKYREALSKFQSIPTQALSGHKKRQVSSWTSTLAACLSSGTLTVSDPTQWDLWRFPSK